MRGLFRQGDWAHVEEGQSAIPVTRQYYETRGCQPPFRMLPTREEFERRNRG
jgi:hypothetical protein